MQTKCFKVFYQSSVRINEQITDLEYRQLLLYEIIFVKSFNFIYFTEITLYFIKIFLCRHLELISDLELSKFYIPTL